MIKAIETEYNGYKFRSRLEARWAVFFDAMKLEYVYEPEGFTDGKTNYLPDFWIPLFEAYAEVKPTFFTEKQFNKTLILPKPCILLDRPTPESRQAYFVTASFTDENTVYHDYHFPHIDYGPWMLFDYSVSSRRLWWALANLSNYWPDCAPEIAAKSARFEYGHSAVRV